MTKEKLLSVTKRIFKPEFAGLAVQACYLKFVSEFPFTELSKAMNSDDKVMISFLLPHGNNPEVMSNLYDVIKSTLFGFTVMEIDAADPDEECPDCYGDGSEDCGDCGGNGKEDCDDCGGDGEDSEGDTCGRCDGDGTLTCSYCEGDGQVTCNRCDGNGYVPRDGAYAVTQYFVVSYDENLLRLLEVKEENEHTKIKLQTDKTLTLLRKEAVVDNGEEYDVGELYFLELTDSPDLRPSDQTNRVDINNLSDVGD